MDRLLSLSPHAFTGPPRAVRGSSALSRLENAKAERENHWSFASPRKERERELVRVLAAEV
jgi:hypothetical protein